MVRQIFLFVFLHHYIICSQYPSIDDYIIQYNRTYTPGTQQYDFRKGIYNERIHNFSYITQYQPAINNLTDRTHDQIQSMKGQRIKASNLVSNKRIKISGQAPQNLDWRDQLAVTSIKNQGSCGSCWSFTAIAYIQSYLIIHYNYSKYDLDLSQQFVLQCSFQSSCDGGYTQYALQGILEYGIVTENQSPYNPYNTTYGLCSKGKFLLKDEQQVMYTNLNDQQIIELLQISPVGISISSDDWQYAGSGIFACKENSVVDHAVLLVGYTQDYWIIKNSWGASWGQSGFGKITRNQSVNCKIGEKVNVIQKLSQKVYKISAIIILYLTIIFL